MGDLGVQARARLWVLGSLSWPLTSILAPRAELIQVVSRRDIWEAKAPGREKSPDWELTVGSVLRVRQAPQRMHWWGSPVAPFGSFGIPNPRVHPIGQRGN